MKNLKLLFASLITVTFVSCSNDDSSPVNEEEVITTVRVTLVNGGNTITLQSKDPDGDGPLAPILTPDGGVTLSPNTTYSGTIAFLNELATPTTDITAEVEQEGEDHQVFYQLSTAVGTVAYNDLDANGNPIGLDFTLTTGATVGSGSLTVTLIHLPNKSAAGVSSGDMTNAGGSTDAEVTFSLAVN